MQLDANRGKSAAIDSGAALGGAIAAHALTNFASEKLLASDPTSTYGKFIPLVVVGICLGVQAFGLTPKDNDAVNSALLGATVVSGMSAVRELSGANDDTKNTEGVAKLVSQYVPSLSGLGTTPTYDYTESAAALRYLGEGQRALSQSTWSPAAAAAPEPVKLRVLG